MSAQLGSSKAAISVCLVRMATPSASARCCMRFTCRSPLRAHVSVDLARYASVVAPNLIAAHSSLERAGEIV